MNEGSKPYNEGSLNQSRAPNYPAKWRANIELSRNGFNDREQWLQAETRVDKKKQ
jgi:hypothetical protein